MNEEFRRLEELVGQYPEQEYEYIQGDLESRKEFRELFGEITESVTPGEYFVHQKIIRRLLQVYDRIYLKHETGTGKTCAFIAVSEYYKTFSQKTGYLPKAFIFTRGPNLVKDIQYQLVCRCTNRDEYFEKIKMRTEKARGVTQMLTRLIHKYYTIDSYGTLANKLKSMKDEDIKAEYSNSILVFDEIHSLHYDEESGRKTDTTRYEQILRLVDNVIGCKIIILSATPMFNESSELSFVMNVVLPKEKRIPGDFDYENATLDNLFPYLNGYISYVRQLPTKAYPNFLGRPLSVDYRSIVYPVTISDFQKQHYLETYTEDGSKQFYQNTRWSSLFIFPDGKSTTSDEYVKNNDGRFALTKEFVHNFSRNRETFIEQISVYSSKFAEAFRIITKQRGNVFVYSEFVTAGPGCILFGLLLELLGYARYTVQAPEEREELSYQCDEPETAVNISKKDRYAIITGETNRTEITEIIRIFNSRENINGEIIKCIIGSKVTREGLSFNNVQHIIILTPEWNYSSLYQAISRGIRATSHVELLKIHPEGLPINIYCLANDFGDINPDSDNFNIDYYMYKTSEDKDIKIKKIERIIKQSAIDCLLLKDQNKLIGQDGSPLCDYQSCTYSCANQALGIENKSTYYYTYDEKKTQLIYDIYTIMNTRNIVSLEELMTILKIDEKYFITRAIHDLISEHRIMIDRFGRNMYLSVKDDYIMYQPDPMDSDISLSWYYENYYASSVYNLNTIKIALPSVMGEISEELDKLDDDISKLTLSAKANLLEEAVVRSQRERNNNKLNGIIRVLEPFLFIIRRPEEEYAKLGTPSAPKRGRPRTRPVVSRLDFETVDMDIYRPSTGDRVVYIHNIYLHDAPESELIPRIEKAEGRLRIFDPLVDKSWKDCFPPLTPEAIADPESTRFFNVYNTAVKAFIGEREFRFRDKEIYGVMTNDIFKIRDQRGKMGVTDARYKSRGRSCGTILVKTLFEYMWIFKIEPEPPVVLPDFSVIEEKLSISKYNEPDWAQEKKEFYYKLLVAYATAKKGDVLCPILVKYFKHNDLLLIL